MRHRVKGKQLNRDTNNRRGLFKNLIKSILTYGHIQTTVAKANAIESSLEKILTKAKSGTLNDRRQIDMLLNSRDIVNRLVDGIAPNLTRTSGYTRIVKLGSRKGDDAAMVRLEIIDFKVTDKAAKEVVKAVAKTPAKKTPAKAEKIAPTVEAEVVEEGAK